MDEIILNPVRNKFKIKCKLQDDSHATDLLYKFESQWFSLNYILNAASKLIESCHSSVSYFDIISFVGFSGKTFRNSTESCRLSFIKVGILKVNWKAGEGYN